MPRGNTDPTPDLVTEDAERVVPVGVWVSLALLLLLLIAGVLGVAYVLSLTDAWS
jgi:hypothetical protein